MILNIETSSKICSVALCEGGDCMFYLSSDKEMEHSARLAPFVEECMKELERRGMKLDAVAVSIGPGSYTGLRIGLSLAKGLCFSRNLPLIGVPTLKILAVKGLFSLSNPSGDELYVPVIDARRMEVYTAVYDAALNEIMEPCPLIIDESSFAELGDRPVLFIGDAVTKMRNVVPLPNAKWIESYPLARDMNALSEMSFRRKDFIDVAYSTPYYLKNFQATTPKNKVL